MSLIVAASTATLAPAVRVTAQDQFGLPSDATVTLDVDLNNDGNFTDAGETGYATGTLADGQVDIKLPALSGRRAPTGCRRGSTTWRATRAPAPRRPSCVVTVDGDLGRQCQVADGRPAGGDGQDQLGDVSMSHSPGPGPEPGTSQGGEPGAGLPLVSKSASSRSCR